MYSHATTYQPWGSPLLDLDQKDFWKWISGGVGVGAALKVIGKLLDYWRPTKKQEMEADEQFNARLMARCLQLEGDLNKALADHRQTIIDHRAAMDIVHRQYEARIDSLLSECRTLYRWAIQRGYDPDAGVKA